MKCKLPPPIIDDSGSIGSMKKLDNPPISTPEQKKALDELLSSSTKINIIDLLDSLLNTKP